MLLLTSGCMGGRVAGSAYLRALTCVAERPQLFNFKLLSDDEEPHAAINAWVASCAPSALSVEAARRFSHRSSDSSAQPGARRKSVKADMLDWSMPQFASCK